MRNKYDLVIFDLDGTLVDSDLGLVKIGLELSKYFLPKKDVTVDDYLYLNGPPLSESLAVLFPEADVSEVIAKYYELAADSIKDITLFKKTITALQTLKKNDVRLAIFTSRHRKSTDLIVKKFALAQYFELIVAGNDGFKGKPSGEAIRHIYEKLGEKPARTLYVGDNWRDVLAAKDANVEIAFILPYRRRFALDLTVDYELNDINDVVEVVVLDERK